MFVSKKQRIERSASEIERLRSECHAWADLRHKKDEKNQFKTQLNALSELVDRASTAIKSALPQPDDNLSLDDTYEQCRFLDSRIAWTRRLWEFFQEKFDQRDGPHGPMLYAADEVIWSCYREPFEWMAASGGPP